MKTICAAACLAVAALAANGQENLFDGRTLDHWEGDPRYWRVEDGTITGEIPAGQTLDRNQWIFWDGEIGDFELDVEFRLSGGPKANSGIQYRCQQHPDGHASGYQADLDDGATWLGRIYDEHGRALLVERGNRVSIAPDGRRWTDAFAEPRSFQSMFRKEGWNTYRITAAASHVEIWVNGIRCSVLDDHQADAAEFAGRLAFQLHSAPGPAKIQFRNIRLTRFGHTEPPPHAELGHSGVDAGTAPRAIAAAGADGTPLNLGFEKGTLEGWTATGDAWDRQPVQGDTVASRRRGNSQHAGNFWLGGYERVDDKGTGTLTSAAFPVSHPWASFLIGGGDDLRQTRVEIVDAASGKVIHAAAGRKRENMERVSVDLTGEIGKQVFVRIVDMAKGGWGHVNYDDFQFHDARPAVANVAVAAADGDRTARLHDSPVLWHLGPNPAKPTAVANAGAQKLVAGMKLTQGFQAELIAAEPDVRQPVAFCMDERGRLWVAEAYSYPTKQPDGKGRDRILIFEDKDGDGTFETRQTFLEGLNLVSGLEIGFGGVWVGAAPQLLFIPRDANDRPGKPEVLLDGWGYQDTHETLNSFIWGPDGWLYGNQGVFTESLIGKPGAPNNKRVPMHSGVWRYHPVRRQFEVFAFGGSNQWGLDYNSRGHFFMTHCRSFWGKGGTTNAIRNGHFWNQANSRYAPFISATAPDFAPELQNYLPASARYDSGEGGAGKPGTTAVYGGHSHVGTMIYQGDNWPAIYHDHLFTHNLHGHQLNHQHNVRSGSAYETLHAGYDLLFSDDPQYIPVDLQAGPDGAVYVIDWCDTQHCHNPAEEKWDRSNGRIYRVSWAATYRPRQVDLGKLADLDLAKLQTHPNDWHTRMARRLLQERAATRKIDEAAIDCLRSLAAGGEPAIALKALWALHLIGAVEPAIGPASRHSDEGVRAWAVQLATDQGGRSLLDSSALVAMAKNDSSSMVRLALASALPVLDHATAWDVATALSAHAEDAGDRFLPKMIWFGLAGVISEDFDRGLDLAEAAPMPSLADSIRWYAGTQREGRDRLIARMPSRPHEAAIRDLRLLAFALKDEASAPMPPAWPAAARAFEGDKVPAVRTALDTASAIFGDRTVVARMRALLADTSQPLPERRRALDLLRRIGDAEAAPIFAGLLEEDGFRSAVIPLLSRSTDPAVAIALMVRFESLTGDDRSAALGTLTSRRELALPMVKAVAAGEFNKKYITALQIRQLRNLHDDEVDARLDQVWGKVNESPAAARESMASFRQAYTAAPLWAFDAKAGGETFQQVCAVCHAMNGVGGKLGPDLAGSWRNGLDYFLENIIDPNAVVGENFQLNVVTRKSGAVLSGVIELDTPTAISMRTITESVVIPKSDILSRQKLPQSLMPPGLLEALPQRKSIELLKYLLTRRE